MRRPVGYVVAVVAALLLWPLSITNVLLPLGSPVLVMLAVGTQTDAIRAYTIPSSAMEPTLHCAEPAPGCESDRRDRIVTLGWAVSYGRRDIVAFKTPPAAKAKCGAGGTIVKRIIGLPGERVGIRLRRGAAFVYIDGKRLEEPYIENDRRDIGPEESFKVPVGQYFVMGDNRSQSCDSRVWGSVPEENLIGKVFMTYWPPQRISFR